jgi:hypothetical protein
MVGFALILAACACALLGRSGSASADGPLLTDSAKPL